MPDTTYTIKSNNPYVTDSMASAKMRAEVIASKKEVDRQNTLEAIGFLVLALGVLVIGICKVARSNEKGWYIIGKRKPWNNRYYDDRNYDDRFYTEYVPAEPPSNPDKNYLVYEGSTLGLSRQDSIIILQKHYPYYNNLNPTLKSKFVNRLLAFMKEKRFIIYSNEGFKEMPVLLSAAAIQLTFGLEKYMLPNFKYLQIHPHEYFAKNSFRVLAGNVEGESITIAWNQFLKGFQNPTDGVNVGLHEMAHAVYYQHVIVDKEREKDFCNCFNEVMEEGAEVYELKTTHQVLFSNYAFKDLQEFWAETVELFFERPFDLKNNYAELYEATSDLLNQNPCNASNPVLA